VEHRQGLTDYAPLEAARINHATCKEALVALPVRSADAHHYHHLCAAGAALDHAIGAALSAVPAKKDDLFRALEEAERHFKALARMLPGFEPVDFAQACCAAHAGPGGASARKTRNDWGDNGRLFDLGAGLRCG
jgi:hypothetical protein